jgi:RNA polymerase sigma-70 factor, ECF subfamily
VYASFMLRDAYLRNCAEPSEPPELEQALEHIVREAGERWTQPSTLLRHLGRAIPNAASVPGLATSFSAEDFAIAVAALEGNAAAQAYIAKEHLSEVHHWIARLDSSPAFADDVRQELASMLFAPADEQGSKLLGYSGRGPLGGFLRTIAYRTAQNMRRKKRELPEIPNLEAPATARSTPEGALGRADHARAFTEQLRSAIVALSHDERELLRMHYLEGMSLEAVAAARGISRATAARRLADARHSVLSLVRSAHAQQAGPVTRSGSGGIDIPSELALSLSKIFRTE